MYFEMSLLLELTKQSCFYRFEFLLLVDTEKCVGDTFPCVLAG